MPLKFKSFDDIKNLMNDENSLKILFYLREFNPNVSIANLEKNIGINEKGVKEKINQLIEFGIVEFGIVEGKELFKLTKDGRELVNSFYHDIGEELPKDTTT